MIENDYRLLSLRLIMYAGIGCLFGVIIQNFFGNQDLQTTLLNLRDDYENIDWSSDMRIIQTQMIGDYNLKILVKMNLFSLFSDQQQTFINRINSSLKSNNLQMKNKMLSFYNSPDTPQTITFNIIQKTNSILEFAQGWDDQDQVQTSFSFVESSMLAYFYELESYSEGSDKVELQILVNYSNIISILESTDNKGKEQVYLEYSNMIDNALTDLITDILFSAIFSLTFIPLYVFVQIKRQKILNIFTTFSPNRLSEIINSSIDAKNTIDSQIKQRLTFPLLEYSSKNIIPRTQIRTSSTQFTIEKKKSIGTATQLPLFKWGIIIISIIFFMVNMIYSFSDEIILNQFFSNQKENREFIGNIFLKEGRQVEIIKGL